MRKSLVLACWDAGLRKTTEALLHGLEADWNVAGHGLFAEKRYDQEEAHLQEIMRNTKLVVVCVTGIAASEVRTIRAAFEADKRVALIVEMADQWKWHALRSQQIAQFYHCVVSVRGPNKRLPHLLPSVRTLHVDYLAGKELDAVVSLINGDWTGL